MLVSSTFVVPPVPPVFSRPGAFLCYCETLRPKESSFFNVNIIHISNPLPKLCFLFPSTKPPYNDNNFHERKENRVEILFLNVNILHIIARALFREFLFPSAFHAAAGGGGSGRAKGHWRALSSALPCIFCSALQGSLRFVLSKKFLLSHAV